MTPVKSRIVADSSCDIRSLAHVPFAVAPLKIITAQTEYTDDEHLDVYGMVTALETYKGKSSTSCPNAGDWLTAFGDAEQVFCVTITGTLSGSYNAALLAKSDYEAQHPDRRVFVLNSLTAGPEIALLLEKLQALILEEKSFPEICRQITEYQKKTGLLFVLESMNNLANNGRVSPLVAKMAGLLGIRVVGRASDRGDLQPLNKCRGESRALDAVVSHLRELGFSVGRVKIAHCFHESAAAHLRDRIAEAFPEASAEIYPCGGLCSFYAEKGGLLIGFETA